eukprot:10332363-Lingulodinium_polyedra.AAC.1
MRVQTARDALDRCIAGLSPEAKERLTRENASPQPGIPVPDGFESEGLGLEQDDAAVDNPVPTD